MKFQDMVCFLETNHRGVISTKAYNGATHSSIVVCGAYDGNAAFVSVYPRSQKISNLRRNADCTVLAVSEDWRYYAVIEGKANLFDYDNTDSAEMKILLREIYMICSDTPHPNWDEYDDAMIRQKGVVVLVPPDKVYGVLGPREMT